VPACLVPCVLCLVVSRRWGQVFFAEREGKLRCKRAERVLGQGEAGQRQCEEPSGATEDGWNSRKAQRQRRPVRKAVQMWGDVRIPPALCGPGLGSDYGPLPSASLLLLDPALWGRGGAEDPRGDPVLLSPRPGASIQPGGTRRPGPKFSQGSDGMPCSRLRGRGGPGLAGALQGGRGAGGRGGAQAGGPQRAVRSEAFAAAGARRYPAQRGHRGGAGSCGSAPRRIAALRRQALCLGPSQLAKPSGGRCGPGQLVVWEGRGGGARSAPGLAPRAAICYPALQASSTRGGGVGRKPLDVPLLTFCSRFIVEPQSEAALCALHGAAPCLGRLALHEGRPGNAGTRPEAGRRQPFSPCSPRLGDVVIDL